MTDQPYTPPSTPIDEFLPQESGLPWHAIGLAVLLTLWGLWAFGLMLYALSSRATLTGVGLLNSYLFLLNPVLILTAAYMLYRRNRHVVLPLAMVAILYFLFAMRLMRNALIPLSQQPGSSFVSQFINYISQFPLVTHVNVLFFLACSVYCLWLRKRGKLV